MYTITAMGSEDSKRTGNDVIPCKVLIFLPKQQISLIELTFSTAPSSKLSLSIFDKPII